MDTELSRLLLSVKKDDNKNFTHVTAYGPAERFTVDPGKYGDFWTGYCELVYNQSKDSTANICLKENNKQHMPVIFELEFVFPQANGKEYINDLFVESLVFCAQRALAELYDLGTPEEHQATLTSTLMESSWNDDPEAKRKFTNTTSPKFHHEKLRIQFPYCRVEAEHQVKVLRPRFIELLRSKNVLTPLEEAPIHDWETIIAKDTVLRPVLMYGSEEHPGMPKLQLTRIYSIINDPEDPEAEDNESEIGASPVGSGDSVAKCGASHDGKKYSLVIAFDFVNHHDITAGLLNLDLIETHNKRLVGRLNDEPAPDNCSIDETVRRYWLPLFLSVDYWQKLTLPQNANTVVRGAKTNPRGLRLASVETPDLDIAQKLLNYCNLSERFGNYNSRTEIGKALRWCAAHDDKRNDLLVEHALNIWLQFVQKYAPTKVEECRKQWPNFINPSVTLRTIAWFAREDNPHRYEDWHRQWCDKSFELALTLTHTDVARALYRCYWLDYICQNDATICWYEFEQHRWRKIDKGVDLSKVISSDFVRRFEEYRQVLTNRNLDSGDEAARAVGEIAIKKVCALITKLKMGPFKANIMREAAEWFYLAHLSELMDANPETMGVLDGVIECNIESKKAILRRGKPEDYISKQSLVAVGRKYENKYYNRLIKWLTEVFPRSRPNKDLVAVEKKSTLLELKESKYSLKLEAPPGYPSGESLSAYSLKLEAPASQRTLTGELPAIEGPNQPSLKLITPIIDSPSKEADLLVPVKPAMLKEVKGTDPDGDQGPERDEEELNDEDENQDWRQNLKRKIPRGSLAAHFLKFVASCIKSRNSDKIFPIFTGNGDNSKSMIVKLIEMAFGQYCIKFPTSLFTGKRGQSSGPTPELARARCAKIAFAQEPGPDEQIQGGILKEITGGDSFYARMLHDNGGDVKASFKVILQCNKPPIIPNADKAIHNRTKVFPFMSNWIDFPEDLKHNKAFRRKMALENKFDKDPHFEDQIETLAGPFLHILYDIYFPIYSIEGLKQDPPEVVKETNNYWETSDIYRMFVNDCITPVRDLEGNPDTSKSLNFSDIFDRFKDEWFKRNFPEGKKPSRPEVLQGLEGLWGKFHYLNSWRGIKFNDEVGVAPTQAGNTLSITKALGKSLTLGVRKVL